MLNATGRKPHAPNCDVDVYKRQLKNIESSFRQIRLFGIVFLSLCTVVTVSYTHLDVYKRQTHSMYYATFIKTF